MPVSKIDLRALYSAWEKEAEKDVSAISRARTSASKNTPDSFLSPEKLEGKKEIELPYKRLGVKLQDLVAAYASMGVKPEISGNVIKLSPEDLRKIVRHREKRGTRFQKNVKGMPYSQLLRTSTAKDKERAKLVQTARLYGRKGNLLFFQVSGNDKPFYRVQIRLEEWETFLTNSVPALSAVKQILQGRLSIECPCGRHQFWYRYLASIGNYAIAPIEKDFPKIRNPSLTGCCCKHVLKVLHELKLNRVLVPLARQLEQDRNKIGFAGSYRKKILSADDLRIAHTQRMTQNAQKLLEVFREQVEKLKTETSIKRKTKKQVKKTPAKSTEQKDFVPSQAQIRALKDILKMARTYDIAPDVMLDGFAKKQNLTREQVNKIIQEHNL